MALLAEDSFSSPLKKSSYMFELSIVYFSVYCLSTSPLSALMNAGMFGGDAFLSIFMRE